MRYQISHRAVRILAGQGFTWLLALSAALGPVSAISATPNRPEPVEAALALPAIGSTPDDVSKDAYKPSRINLPMSYEENRGQFADGVQFVGRGSSLSLFVSGTETSIEVSGPRREDNG